MRYLTGTTLLLLLALAPPAALRAGEASPMPAALVATEGAAHPCTFYRSQANRMGVTHFLTEMHWACQEIVARRSAGMRLSDRLLATEHALIAYRAALGTARARGEGTHLSMSEARKREIAESTGVLAALESIASGF